MKGYTNQILYLDLSTGATRLLPTAVYAGNFLGGRGLAARLYWELVPAEAAAFSPENGIAFMTGPLTGFPRISSPRTELCSRTALMDPESFTYASLGGGWGPRLKAAGYDGLFLQGRAETPVYCHLHDGVVDIRDASHLWGKTTVEAYHLLKQELGAETSVVTIGPAGENLVKFAIMYADDCSLATGGLGAVLGAKNVKAIAVTPAADATKAEAADPDRFRDLSVQFQAEFKSATAPPLPWIIPGRTKPQMCRTCGIGCHRHCYEGADGILYRSYCQAGEFYSKMVHNYHGGWEEAILDASRLCDSYGLCSEVVQVTVEWLYGCYREGLLSEKDTDLPLAKIGTSEFIESLVKKIAYREGFGEVLSGGALRAATAIGGRAEEIIGYSVLTRASEPRDYDPRLFPLNALFYATESRRTVDLLHEASAMVDHWVEWLDKGGPDGEHQSLFNMDFFHKAALKYWGSVEAADYTTLKGKALGSKRTQDRVYGRNCTVVCSSKWGVFPLGRPNRNVTDPSELGGFLTAITGREYDGDALDLIGERAFNMHRAIKARQGWGGREGDILVRYVHDQPLKYRDYNLPPPTVRMSKCRVPDINGEPVLREGSVVDRDEFEETKTEYYAYRGWDPTTGLQTRSKLVELGLGDVADDLAARGLLVEQ